ncbi:polysaccharide biosynthesis/export family protein [Desertivirga xinjiangensis]|uniref:polysaccharide biosynthesis/export family protein n=1 Tax=Desertivirga xinjiangensis TaxID=539206 RepID=UPI0021087668|nr:polysaccharide biosynthesis/export family protein [Pedobacter xinjiangensis]
MKYFLYICLLWCFSSCGVKYQSIPYFTDLSKEPVASTAIVNHRELNIQKGDAFLLEVTSLNTMASAVFNSGSAAVVNSSANKEVGSPSGSYMVDSEGNIRIPLAGSVNIEGLSIIEARKKIEEQLMAYLKEPVVNLKLVNYRVSVLGDVMKPGAYLIDRENINVVEAISLAGDLNITAKRNDVLLIRENGEKREYIRLDLQSKVLFDSPYYYLKSGDILYVQPGEAKYASIDSKYRNIGLGLSLISVLALVFSQLNR